MLLQVTSQNGKRIEHDPLLRVVHENDKPRFAVSDYGVKIWAKQGRSVNVDLELKPDLPPAVLYHGTVERLLASIWEKGLIPGTRQHAHLSPHSRTAETVGQRRGEPVVLVVATAEMHLDGIALYLSGNGVWLTGHVPTTYGWFPQS